MFFSFGDHPAPRRGSCPRAREVSWRRKGSWNAAPGGQAAQAAVCGPIGEDEKPAGNAIGVAWPLEGTGALSGEQKSTPNAWLGQSGRPHRLGRESQATSRPGTLWRWAGSESVGTSCPGVRGSGRKGSSVKGNVFSWIFSERTIPGCRW